MLPAYSPSASSNVASSSTLYQRLTLVHISAQPEPVLVIESTASVHYSTSKLKLSRSCDLKRWHNQPQKMVHNILTSGGVQPTKGAYV